MADAARKTVPPSGKLNPQEVKDERDTTPRVRTDETSGKRVRAIPAKGGTVVRVTQGDFKSHGVNSPTVEFAFLKDNFTLPVGGSLSKEAADFLTKQFPESFEYMS
jgi:hypothetical protein